MYPAILDVNFELGEGSKKPVAAGISVVDVVVVAGGGVAEDDADP